MKKLFTVFAAAAVLAAGLYAQDVTNAMDTINTAGNAIGEATGASESLQGVWFDKKYNCNWQFQVNTGSEAFCVLKDADTNAVIYTFTRSNVKNFRGEMQSNQFVLSWESEAKNRVYKFAKDFSGSKDLKLDIYHNVYQERHNATITYVSADARVD